MANVNIVTVKGQDSTIVCWPHWRFLLIMVRTLGRLVAPKMMIVCSLQSVAVYWGWW